MTDVLRPSPDGAVDFRAPQKEKGGRKENKTPSPLLAKNVSDAQTIGDNVGAPDFQTLAEGVVARRDVEGSAPTTSSRVDLFLNEHQRDFPRFSLISFLVPLFQTRNLEM